MNIQTADINPHKDRRRWWVALLMLFPTGAGYIYVGRPWRFVVYMLALLTVAVLMLGDWSWMKDTILFQVVFALGILGAIGFATDIVMIAIKQTSHNLRWAERRKWYLANLAVWGLIALVVSSP